MLALFKNKFLICRPQRVNVLTSLSKTKYLVNDFEKIIKLFPPGRAASKIRDYE